MCENVRDVGLTENKVPATIETNTLAFGGADKVTDIFPASPDSKAEPVTMDTMIANLSQ